jgi:hypothetical protein
VDSIEILETGIRVARSKTDFLGRRLGLGQFGPHSLSFAIWVNSYDCAKQIEHLDSMEIHVVDGSIHSSNFSRDLKWFPAEKNPAADPAFGFVCEWKPKSH